VITAHIFIIISRYELGLNRRISASTNTLINRDEIFKNSRLRPFWPQNKRRNFGRAGCRTSWPETKKMQITLATTCNTNEQQQYAKNMHSYATYYLAVSLLRYFSALFLDCIFIW